MTETKADDKEKPTLSYNEKQHLYWYDGKRCKGVTTVAKIPDDTYGLDRWGKRMVALGMALSPPLIERALAHHDDKNELSDVAEDATRAAKANEAAARGTAIHRVLERHDLGESIIDTPESKALRSAYDKALLAAGLEVVPEYIERIIVHPKQMVAGRFDRIFWYTRGKRFVIGDVKSGTNAVTYPHSIAVQLALYANAPLMAGPLPRAGGKTDVFEKLPEMDLKWGYIIHAPGGENVEVVKVDIAGGWDIAKKAIFPILAWRARKDLTTALGSTNVKELMEPATAERVSWILGRLQIFKMLENSGDAMRLTALRWPEGIGKPATSGAWTEADIDALDVALTSVEKDCSVPFGADDPDKVRIAA